MASPLCAGPGDMLERMKCCASGAATAAFAIEVRLPKKPKSAWTSLFYHATQAGSNVLGKQARKSRTSSKREVAAAPLASQRVVTGSAPSVPFRLVLGTQATRKRLRESA